MKKQKRGADGNDEYENAATKALAQAEAMPDPAAFDLEHQNLEEEVGCR